MKEKRQLRKKRRRTLSIFGILILAVCVYVTVNIVFHDKDVENLGNYLKKLYEIGVDAVIFSDPLVIDVRKKYAPLLQIDINMRKRVAEYMRKNNYKLKGGKQEFIRNNPSFKELIEDGFQFEKISRQGDS